MRANALGPAVAIEGVILHIGDEARTNEGHTVLHNMRVAEVHIAADQAVAGEVAIHVHADYPLVRQIGSVQTLAQRSLGSSIAPVLLAVGDLLPRVPEPAREQQDDARPNQPS